MNVLDILIYFHISCSPTSVGWMLDASEVTCFLWRQ